MDNMEYLNKIAAKPAAKSGVGLGPLSATALKILIGAAIALVLIIILGLIINGTGGKSNLYESLYLRLQNLSSDSGPIATYSKNLKSSDLRATSGALKSSLTATSQKLSTILEDLNIDPENISTSTLESETAILDDYTLTLQNAKLNGLLDRSFASSTTLQISRLLALENQILEKNPPESLTAILTQSIADLEILHTNFTDLSNSTK